MFQTRNVSLYSGWLRPDVPCWISITLNMLHILGSITSRNYQPAGIFHSDSYETRRCPTNLTGLPLVVADNLLTQQSWVHIFGSL